MADPLKGYEQIDTASELRVCTVNKIMRGQEDE